MPRNEKSEILEPLLNYGKTIVSPDDSGLGGSILSTPDQTVSTWSSPTRKARSLPGDENIGLPDVFPLQHMSHPHSTDFIKGLIPSEQHPSVACHSRFPQTKHLGTTNEPFSWSGKCEWLDDKEATLVKGSRRSEKSKDCNGILTSDSCNNVNRNIKKTDINKETVPPTCFNCESPKGKTYLNRPPSASMLSVESSRSPLLRSFCSYRLQCSDQSRLELHKALDFSGHSEIQSDSEQVQSSASLKKKCKPSERSQTEAFVQHSPDTENQLKRGTRAERRARKRKTRLWSPRKKNLASGSSPLSAIDNIEDTVKLLPLHRQLDLHASPNVFSPKTTNSQHYKKGFLIRAIMDEEDLQSDKECVTSFKAIQSRSPVVDKRLSPIGFQDNPQCIKSPEEFPEKDLCQQEDESRRPTSQLSNDLPHILPPVWTPSLDSQVKSTLSDLHFSPQLFPPLYSSPWEYAYQPPVIALDLRYPLNLPSEQVISSLCPSQFPISICPQHICHRSPSSPVTGLSSRLISGALDIRPIADQLGLSVPIDSWNTRQYSPVSQCLTACPVKVRTRFDANVISTPPHEPMDSSDSSPLRPLEVASKEVSGQPKDVHKPARVSFETKELPTDCMHTSRTLLLKILEKPIAMQVCAEMKTEPVGINSHFTGNRGKREGQEAGAEGGSSEIQRKRRKQPTASPPAVRQTKTECEKVESAGSARKLKSDPSLCMTTFEAIAKMEELTAFMNSRRADVNLAIHPEILQMLQGVERKTPGTKVLLKNEGFAIAEPEWQDPVPGSNIWEEQQADGKRQTCIHAPDGRVVKKKDKREASRAVRRGKHTGQYMCIYCTRRFADATDMVRHTRKHTKVSPFVCEVCKKAFTQLVTKEKHQWKDHGIPEPPKGKLRQKVHICELCGLLFDQQDGYKEHLMRFHPYHSHLQKLNDGRIYKKDKNDK